MAAIASMNCMIQSPPVTEDINLRTRTLDARKTLPKRKGLNHLGRNSTHGELIGFWRCVSDHQTNRALALS